MTLDTTQLDKLRTLFDQWSNTIALYSLSAKSIDVSPDESEAEIFVRRADVEFCYYMRAELRNCIAGIVKEAENNLLSVNYDQHVLIYLKKLAALFTPINSFLREEYAEQSDLITRLKYKYEKPEGQSFPFQNEYILEEQFGINKHIPITVRLLKMIGEGFIIAAKILHSTVTQSLLYKQHADLIQISPSNTAIEKDDQAEESDKSLSAFQKMLFIRLLQAEQFFPRKPHNTDDAPELKAIGLLTGLDYANQIKGGKGANSKVNYFLDDLSRSTLSPDQSKSKLHDLNAVKKVAQLLNANSIVARIDKYREELNRIIED